MKSFLKPLSLALFIFVFVFIPLSASAFFSVGQQTLLVAQDEIIDGDYIAFGNTINIAGKVNGDIIAAGSAITVSGDVAGDIIAAGSSINVSGKVYGSIRVAGSTVDINGVVERNLNAAGSTVTIGDKAEIGRNAYIAGASIQVNGPIKGELNVSGATIIISNEIGKSVYADLGGDGTIIIQPSAKINGNLTYKSCCADKAQIKDGAQIAGKTDFQATSKKSQAAKNKYNLNYFFGKIFSLFGSLVIGLVLITLMPKIILRIGAEMESRPAASFGWGLIYLIIVPVLLILLAVTIIGIPLALISLPLYVISVFISKIIAGIVFGLLIYKHGFKKTNQPNLILAMVLGLIALVIITSLPMIGWFIKLLVTLWALGAIFTTVRKSASGWR